MKSRKRKKRKPGNSRKERDPRRRNPLPAIVNLGFDTSKKGSSFPSEHGTHNNMDLSGSTTILAIAEGSGVLEGSH